MFAENFIDFEQLFWKLLIKTLILLFTKQRNGTNNNRKSSNFGYFLIFYFLFNTTYRKTNYDYFSKYYIKILEIIIQNKTNNSKKGKQ